QVYFYHLDHLGTPQEISDARGNIVWSVQYRAYGNVARKQVEHIQNNLRFQGQYFDEETGLHYNRHRYYDPGLGRFINQDPIGIKGGLNLYKYAPNPVMWVDPFGLVKVYRNLRMEDNPARGFKKEDPVKRLVANKPGRNMTVDGHVRTGSRNKGSQFISTTLDREVAAKWNVPGQTTVMFDTDDIIPDELGNRQVIDISTREKAASHGVKGVPLNFVGDSKEVLVVGKVPASAISIVDIKAHVKKATDCK
ncbi:RHS repeat domain-containing protein, partial [Spartinivicinus poritis]